MQTIKTILIVATLFLSINAQETKNEIEQIRQNLKLLQQKIRNTKYESKSAVFNMNSALQNIMTTRIDDFVYKVPQQVVLYCRESYDIIENKYVVKHPEGFVKILIKKKNRWDFK